MRTGAVGYLTLVEALNEGYITVGDNYKRPRWPVYVICSESHYSVLFGLETALTESDATEPFDLYYFDELARQDERIRYTRHHPCATLGPLGLPGGSRHPWGFAVASLSCRFRLSFGCGCVCRLTIDPSPAIAPPKFDPNVKDFTPPLEHCIRTHWEGAVRLSCQATPSIVDFAQAACAEARGCAGGGLERHRPAALTQLSLSVAFRLIRLARPSCRPTSSSPRDTSPAHHYTPRT